MPAGSEVGGVVSFDAVCPELPGEVSSGSVWASPGRSGYASSTGFPQSRIPTCGEAPAGLRVTASGKDLRKVSKSPRSSACIMWTGDDGDGHRCGAGGSTSCRVPESTPGVASGSSIRRLAGRPVGFCAEYTHSAFTREHLRQDGAKPSHLAFFFPISIVVASSDRRLHPADGRGKGLAPYCTARRRHGERRPWYSTRRARMFPCCVGKGPAPLSEIRAFPASGQGTYRSS